MNRLNVCVLGDSNCGKTCILLRETRDIFEPQYIPTIQDYFETRMVMNQKKWFLSIVDTSGKESLNSTKISAIQSSNCFILVYSIDSKNSYSKLEKYKSMIEAHTVVPNAPLILCANKSDLNENRVVSTELGKSLAEKWNASFFEVSAKQGCDEIKKAFQELINLSILQNMEQNYDGDSCCLLM
ncbi:Ras-like protein rasX [Tritrichomonas foetus]|uniref:Ras-like protein rasX n=1 Tax=Tritrichomonas foetus TaxID=1144522 RepID=A0A1J4KKM6_9EUKA|nr:Ras-like protein rasX [Tritrichomonas foetus]|eukprot:OHT11847.1 Ras-like protein rasX [Tritrichomonas foetus]